MRGSNTDLPIVMEGDGVTSRQASWGAMNAAIERFPAGVDTAPLFRGLPDDRCQCPHWGYVVYGRMTVTYADHTEALSAGDAYYLAPGHTVRFDEPTEVVEFSPGDSYGATMAVVAQNLALMARG